MTSSLARRRCAVLGDPIDHSLSPVLHRAGYAEVGLDWEYDAHRLRERELPGFLAGLDGSWRGLSLTMPLKRTAVGLADRLTPLAGIARAANTLVRDEEGWVGDNTDVPGSVAAITERTDRPLRQAVILGGGATAASTLLALADLGCQQVTLVVRDPARAAETGAAARRHPAPPEVRVVDFGSPAIPADIAVSTIPAAAQTEAVLALVDPAPVVFDVVYDPWPTPLAGRARSAGRTLVSGLDLLVHQAALQFTLMTGVPAPLAAMRAAGEQELARRLRP